MTEAEAAYLAGFMDGEGCVSVSKTGSRGYNLRLQLAQNAPCPLFDTLCVIFGGSVRKETSYNGKLHLKWVVFNRQAEEVLKVVMPYLRLKRTQAELGVAFMGLVGRRGKVISEENLAERERIYLTLKDMHRAGVREGDNAQEG